MQEEIILIAHISSIVSINEQINPVLGEEFIFVGTKINTVYC